MKGGAGRRNASPGSQFIVRVFLIVGVRLEVARLLLLAGRLGLGHPTLGLAGQRRVLFALQQRHHGVPWNEPDNKPGVGSGAELEQRLLF
jgi:hypothetical protein